MLKISKVYRNQLSLVEPTELDFPITVIGAGGVGSWAVLALAKMGCQDITVVDHDKVELKNTPSQLYTLNQVGQPKVEALKNIIRFFTDVDIKPEATKWQDYQVNGFIDSKVIICAVDSIDERKAIYKPLIADWYKKQHFDCYIDVRMGGELLRVLLVNPRDTNSVIRYQKRLFPSSKAHKEPCTARAIVYNTFMCGGIIANYVKKYAKKEPIKYDFIFDIKTGEIH